MISPIELRYILHQNPELGFKEFKTTQILENAINKLKEHYNINVEILKPLETGLIIKYQPVEKNEFVLFRSDIDALPIKEKNNIDFKSKNENMHACGHDIHMSILYGLIKYAFENKIQKNILFLFQPAEEGGGGAKKVIDSGIFNNFNIIKAYALHVTDEYEKGVIATSKGVLFASAVEIDIEFFGKNSHIAFPQDGKNALNALRMFLDSLEKIPNDPVKPLIYGIGKAYSGEVRNVIPAYGKIEGSIRSLSLDHTKEYINKLEKILNSIKEMLDVDYKITLGSQYKEVVNDEKVYKEFLEKIENKYKIIDCGYKMTGEDFGFIAEKYPALMFWLGTKTNKKVGLHSPDFLPDDDVINIGIDIFKKLC
ncbi:N-acetyldiaminopimelate deacetylase [Marinitoga hydrogenitolerans DSM 16785]|uniref:N-acetyldiaminopimelate deacetylase n=1 Tax=Marinitoga hydrogenitolerans (strain DSM 16785 / JCM 12826 / AT1271) TaxID=1122195 RepID=A0A1M4WPF3_MARH1|nr:amidohydrolase [Marinitoga hydrogenitolerans]SHE83057.1 N-acetyldiaminopimelate deacetylase [Marinitoga hydrogenitolerans DSM 16785]